MALVETFELRNIPLGIAFEGRQEDPRILSGGVLYSKYRAS
jgi:hypothetical protein